MTRKFITTICAAAVAATSFTAAPAYAENDNDLARALAAVLGVAIIGKIIHESNRDKDHQVTRRHDRQPQYRVPPPRKSDPIPQNLRPRELPRRVQRDTYRRSDPKLLPGQCMRSFETRRGSVVMFGKRCLENNYRFSNRLPQHCAQRVKSRKSKHHGWDARCLRQNGYRLSRS